MGRGWPEAEAEAADSGKGIGDETVHLSIWTIPQQPQMTAENRHGYEQAKQPTWPGSAVRRKATACLRASCSVPLAQCRHLDSKNVMSQQGPSGQAALHTIRPHGSLQTNDATVGAELTQVPVNPFLSPYPLNQRPRHTIRVAWLSHLRQNAKTLKRLP